MSNPFYITNEIGKLQSVIVKKPGREVENLTPTTMHRLLFDDIPYLKKIREEHDAFTDVLRNNGSEVLYLEELAAEALNEKKVQEEFIQRIVAESHIPQQDHEKELMCYLRTLSPRGLVEETMAGIRKDKVLGASFSALHETNENNLFLMEPMPNLYYTRDPATILDTGISLNQMTFEARKRESLFMEFILDHHSQFHDESIVRLRDRESETSIEGGDILVLNEETLLVGISERTSLTAVKELAHLIFKQRTSFNKVIAIEIPHVRAMMHLDTVFTMVDHDAFTIHPGILKSNGTMPLLVLERTSIGAEYTMTRKDNLLQTLEEAAGKKINLIPCGGGDPIAAPREQWNDGSNTLAIEPGVVVTYDRNYVSNDLLRQNGIRVIEIPSGELSRGRGGPRCMSMPVRRATEH